MAGGSRIGGREAERRALRRKYRGCALREGPRVAQPAVGVGRPWVDDRWLDGKRGAEGVRQVVSETGYRRRDVRHLDRRDSAQPGDVQRHGVGARFVESHDVLRPARLGVDLPTGVDRPDVRPVARIGD